MVKRKLDGTGDESSADRKICKLHSLRKIWRPAPSGTWSYGRLADRPAGWPTKFGQGLKF